MIQALETKNTMLFCSKVTSGWYLPRPGHANMIAKRKVANVDSLTQGKAINQFNDKAVLHYKVSGTICPKWETDGSSTMSSEPWKINTGYWTYLGGDSVYSFDQRTYGAFAVDGYERSCRGMWYNKPWSDNALYYYHDEVVKISEICHVVLSWQTSHYLNRSSTSKSWYETYSATTFYFDNGRYAEYPNYEYAWDDQGFYSCPSGEAEYWTWPNVTSEASAFFDRAIERAKDRYAHTEVRAVKSFGKFSTDKATMLRPLNVSTRSELIQIATNAKKTLDRLKYADIFTRMSAESNVANRVAAGAKRFDSNAIALLIDLPKFGDEIKELREVGRTLRSALSVKQGIKALAKAVPSLYLGYLYGTRLTVKDLGEVGEALEKTMTCYRESGIATSYGKSAYQGTYGSIPYSCLMSKKVYYNPVDTKLHALACANYQWDVFTLENAWDLLPFSFVVDWFINVSSAFEAIDRAGYLSYLKILSTIGSEKYSFQKDIYLSVKNSPQEDAYSICFTLTATKYERSLSSVTTPTFSIQESSGILNHIPEGASIVSQLLT